MIERCSATGKTVAKRKHHAAFDDIPGQAQPVQRQKVAARPRSASPAPPCPHWIQHEISKLHKRFPDDRFDCIMERAYYPDQVPRYGFFQRSPSPTDGFREKIVCYDCLEKTFGVGCTRSLWQFETSHLTKNALHRERVEARLLQEAPIEKLKEKAVKLQQAMESRRGY